MTLTEFLLARFAEDEAKIRALGDEPGRVWWHVTNEWLPPVSDAAAFAARFHPSRMLAECEAKRRIVEDFVVLHDDYQVTRDPSTESRRLQAQISIAQLAAVYADHPDYEEEWRP